MSSGYSSNQFEQYISFNANQPTRGPQSHRRARLAFTCSEVKRKLGLPDDCEILGTMHNYIGNGSVEFCVESPYCQEIPEGSILPVVTIAQLTGFDE